METRKGKVLGEFLVAIILIVAILGVLSSAIRPIREAIGSAAISTADVRYFQGDGIRATWIQNEGFINEIFIVPEDPNDHKCQRLQDVLDEKFGKEPSAEKTIYEAKIKELVGWYDQKDKKPDK